MVSIRKVVGVLSCGFVLCLGLAYAVQAENVPAQAATKMITGELFRIEEEVRFHTDKTTQMIGQIKKGDSIEAKVNDQDHAVLVRQTQ
jgi:hypothetical protein